MAINEPTILLVGVTKKADINQALGENIRNYWHMENLRHIIVTEPTTGRNPAVDAEDLAKVIFANRKDEPIIERNPFKALEIAEIMSIEKDCKIYVMGSVYLVGDVLRFSVERSGGNLWEHLRVH